MIVGMDWDFFWSDEQYAEFRWMWSQGASIEEVANKLGRQVEDVKLLVMELESRDSLPPRGGDQQRPRRTGRKAFRRTSEDVDLAELQVLYRNLNIRWDEICRRIGFSKTTLKQIVQRQHQLNPEEWPLRKTKGITTCRRTRERRITAKSS